MNSKILIGLYKILPSILRNKTVKMIAKIEKGEWQSSTVRTIFKDFYDVQVGFGSYGCFNIGGFSRGTIIGNYCSIATQVKNFNANHPLNEVTTHPIYYNKKFGGKNVVDVKRSKLVIGNDVWIGYGTIILSNCNFIGNGAVIGAGSIITKDIEPYTVVAGVPAKIIKKRFNDEIIKMLEESKWWKLIPNELINFYQYRETPLIFAEKIIMYKKTTDKIPR